MKKIDLTQIITVLANVGVLAGIVFVAYEIRQSNQIAKGTTSYELSRNWAHLNELYITSPDLLDLIVELHDEDFEPKDARQREQIEAYARMVLNNWFAIEDGYANGIVSEEMYMMAAEDVKAVITKRPGIVSAFEPVVSQYNLSRYMLLKPLVAAVEKRRISREKLRSIE